MWPGPRHNVNDRSSSSPTLGPSARYLLTLHDHVAFVSSSGRVSSHGLTLDASSPPPLLSSTEPAPLPFIFPSAPPCSARGGPSSIRLHSSSRWYPMIAPPLLPQLRRQGSFVCCRCSSSSPAIEGSPAPLPRVEAGMESGDVLGSVAWFDGDGVVGCGPINCRPRGKSERRRTWESGFSLSPRSLRMEKTNRYLTHEWHRG